ncbi:MAG TPA: hypothetical protein VKQ52_02190 [Puia sp.]|nr:hypothetical protein [Puia sp.]
MPPITGTSPLQKGYKKFYIIGCSLLLLLAFIQCYSAASGIHWFFDPDYYRDMSCVQQNLYGNFGKDPNYLGAYLWYNPLLTSLETLIVKITGLPLNLAFAKAGIYLNLLAPVTFTLMLATLFDWRIAAAGLLSYLFLSSGNHYTFDAATYSPWLYPGSFTQSIFYLNIIFCYKAFTTQKYPCFLALGAMLGISFLGHTAPTLLIILILVILQTGNLIKSFREKDYAAVRRYIGQGAIVAGLFIVFAMPLLYYIVGKYRLHFINRMPFEFVEPLFIFRNLPTLLRMNFSIAALIALTGVVWAVFNIKQPVIRKIIFAWPLLAIFLFVYSTVVSSLDRNYNIHLPGTVPAFHYFFYLKAAQSVFYGFGLVFLLQLLFAKLRSLQVPRTREAFFIITILLCAIVYFPFYRNRQDFVFYRTRNLQMDKDTDRISTYNYILKNVPSDKVILCEENTSIFPVMATARKMVSSGITYSNPYVDFWQRENARNSMLSYLKTGQPTAAKQLFDTYQVNFILLSNAVFGDPATLSGLDSRLVYKNDSYSLYCIKM